MWSYMIWLNTAYFVQPFQLFSSNSWAQQHTDARTVSQGNMLETLTSLSKDFASCHVYRHLSQPRRWCLGPQGRVWMTELSCYEMWQSGSIMEDHHLSASALSTMIHHLCDTKGQRFSALNSRSISISFFQPLNNLTVTTYCLLERLRGGSSYLVFTEHHKRLTHWLDHVQILSSDTFGLRRVICYHWVIAVVESNCIYMYCTYCKCCSFTTLHYIAN